MRGLPVLRGQGAEKQEEAALCVAQGKAPLELDIDEIHRELIRTDVTL